MQTTTINRKTNETSISLQLTLNSSLDSNIATGIGMLDHMLNLMAFHGNMQVILKASGDLEVDHHHLIEDVGIVLGLALFNIKAENNRLLRFAETVTPMDESLVLTAIDLSGRAYHVFNGDFSSDIGGFPAEMVKHFFYSLSVNGAFNLHQKIFYGENNHHKLEALFKGFGRTIAIAYQLKDKLPSTKGKI